MGPCFAGGSQFCYNGFSRINDYYRDHRQLCSTKRVWAIRPYGPLSIFLENEKNWDFIAGGHAKTPT